MDTNWSRVQFQVDVIHQVRSTGVIMSNPHLHSVKKCPEKSRLIKYGDQMHNVMIAILLIIAISWTEKNYLWCELGQILHRQSHIQCLLTNRLQSSCDMHGNIMVIILVENVRSRILGNRNGRQKARKETWVDPSCCDFIT